MCSRTSGLFSWTRCPGNDITKSRNTLSPLQHPGRPFCRKTRRDPPTPPPPGHHSPGYSCWMPMLWLVVRTAHQSQPQPITTPSWWLNLGLFRSSHVVNLDIDAKPLLRSTRLRGQGQEKYRVFSLVRTFFNA